MIFILNLNWIFFKLCIVMHALSITHTWICPINAIFWVVEFNKWIKSICDKHCLKVIDLKKTVFGLCTLNISNVSAAAHALKSMKICVHINKYNCIAHTHTHTHTHTHAYMHTHPQTHKDAHLSRVKCAYEYAALFGSGQAGRKNAYRYIARWK